MKFSTTWDQHELLMLSHIVLLYCFKQHFLNFRAAILPHVDEELLGSHETAEEPQVPLSSLKPEDVLLGMYLLVQLH